MAYHYIGGMRDQLFLLPVSMRDWQAEGHLAWFVIEVVERVDTTALHARHPNDGPGRRFRRRGLAAAQSEWALMATAHNLGKLHRHN